jgi:tetratricopeptide (TPR) repeat protein
VKLIHEIYSSFFHHKIKLFQKVNGLTRQGRKTVHVFVLILAVIFCFPLTGAVASKGVPDIKPAVQSDRDEDILLSQVRSLIDKDENSRVNMQQVVTLLETIKSQFPDDIRVPLYLAEAYYRMADPEGDIKKTYPYFEKAGDYARQALKLNAESAEAHYWNGLFLLRKAQNAWLLSAYGITKEGIRELELVRDRLPAYDHGGAARVLGLIYYTAPGWSPFGDIDKAVKLEQEATRIAPDYLLNRLYLARAYQKQGDRKATIREYKQILASNFSAARNSLAAKLQGHAREALVSLGQSVD